MPPFDLDTFFALPRLADLALSPDGARLVTTAAVPSADGTRFTSALWEIDPAGERPARRLTRSDEGEAHPVFLPGGALLFTSRRPAPGEPAQPEDERGPALWLLPAGAGEASVVAAPDGGVDGVRVAGRSGAAVFGAAVHPGSTTFEQDRARQGARKEAGVTALLTSSYPLRFWDHWLGPRERRLFRAGAPGSASGGELEDLAPAPGQALHDVDFDVTPDGSTVVTGWWRASGAQDQIAIDLVAVDGAGPTVLCQGDAWHGQVACSPDGRHAVCARTELGGPHGPGRRTLWLVDLTAPSEGGRDLLPGFDRWPSAPAWSGDGALVYFVADDEGHTLPYSARLADGAVVRLATKGAFSDLVVAPDGNTLYALRSSLAGPPEVVALPAGAVDSEPRVLRNPLRGGPQPPGRVERLSATAQDGTAIQSWLVVPDHASATTPAPLVVFMHGGPVMSWSSWSWRWNPHILAAQGYAVLLPDPALSTGYGLDFIRRGWGRWGDEPYTDVLAAVDHALERPDVDEQRTAAMGGSFGGYLANWVAGHTDRFRAIVTHASLWDLPGFHGTTDLGPFWERHFGNPYRDLTRYRDATPNRHVAAIRTPMLVIHGERDHRVPISEALKLWTDLQRHGVPAQLLYFPDEHHWILKPQNARLWYETVLAFLDHHVRDGPWAPPALL